MNLSHAVQAQSSTSAIRPALPGQTTCVFQAQHSVPCWIASKQLVADSFLAGGTICINAEINVASVEGAAHDCKKHHTTPVLAENSDNLINGSDMANLREDVVEQ